MDELQMENNRSSLQQHYSEGNRSVVKNDQDSVAGNAPLTTSDMSNYVFKKYNGATVCKIPKILRCWFVFL